MSVIRSFTTAERDELNPKPGDSIFNSEVGKRQFYNGNKWINLGIGFQLAFSKNANLSGGSFLVSGEVTTDVTHGPLVPIDMTLKTVTISRTDTDAADIEVLCAGIVIATIATSSIAVIANDIDFDCSQGDIISVRNKVGSATMSNVIVVLLFEI